MKKTNKEFSAGSVIFKKEGKEICWLLVKPKGSEKWCFPKAHLNGGESTVMAAKRGIKEEVGIETQILEKIGVDSCSFYQDKKRIFKTVIFYLMEYLGHTEEGFDKETVKIVWLPLRKALTRLSFDKEKELLKEAVDLLKQLEQQQKN